jgi:predicted metalloprotease
MRWRNLGESTHVEDRRGQSAGLRGLPVRGKAGLALLLVVLIAGYYGLDLTPLLTGGSNPAVSSGEPYRPSEQEREAARFTSVALKTTEEAWEQIFRQDGATYRPPRLVLYSGATQTTCGQGQSAMGPFYCPNDQTVYIDLSFYQDMKKRLGGGGDFAQGYVLAHEVGHHVQHLLGIDQKVRRLQSRASQAEANRLSVRLELQADCFAGVWGRAVQDRDILDPGDVEAALRTAEAIGDDRLQRQSTGRVVPDSFTHGSSEQRYTWFRRGFEAGGPEACDTFSGSD